MASNGTRGDRDKSAIAAKLWAAAQNTVDMLTNEDDSDTYNALDDSSCDADIGDETHQGVEMDMGLKIDTVFTLPLDTYLEDKADEPIEKLLEKEQRTKTLVSQCKPCSVVLQRIDHDLAGRQRIFYRQWKRRFNKCNQFCRYKYVDNMRTPEPQVPQKKRKKSSSREKNLSPIETSHQTLIKKISQRRLRDMLNKKSLSGREVLRYMYLNKIKNKKESRGNSSTDQTNIQSTAPNTSIIDNSPKQCANHTLDKVKVKIEPGLEHANSNQEGKWPKVDAGNVKIEPADESEFESYGRKPGVDMVSLLKTTSLEDTNDYSTIKGILGLRKQHAGGAKKSLQNQSIADVLKYKPKASVSSELRDPLKVSMPFAPYKSKRPIDSKPAANSKVLSASSSVPQNQNLKFSSNNAPLVQNPPVLLATGNQIPSSQAPLQLVLTGGGTYGQNQSQIMLTASNPTSTLNPPQFVLTGLNSPPATQNPQQIVLAGVRANNNPQNPPPMILTNANQLANVNMPQIVVASPNTQATSQCRPALVANNGTSGAPRLFFANTNPTLPVSQSTPGQPQVIYTNVYTNPNQPSTSGPLQTGQYVMKQIVQQIQQQPNLLNMAPTQQVPQPATKLQTRAVIPGYTPSSVPMTPQPVPVIQTSSVLPNSMSFPPGTIFFKPNTIPEARPQPVVNALPTALPPKPDNSTATVVENVRGIMENGNKNLPVEGKTVTIGKQKYLLVPAKTLKSCVQGFNAANANNEQKIDKKDGGVSKASVSDKVKNLLERNEEILNQAAALRTQSNTSKSKPVLSNSVPSGARKDGPQNINIQRPQSKETQGNLPLTVSSVTEEPKQKKAKHARKNQPTVRDDWTNGDEDIILIEDPDSPATTAIHRISSDSRKRNPRKSKPTPRLDYDEVLRLQRFNPCDDDSCSDTDVDIETVDPSPEMAGKGMLIPKTPRMPMGVREWPDGATIKEKSITLPANMFENMDESAW